MKKSPILRPSKSTRQFRSGSRRQISGCPPTGSLRDAGVATPTGVLGNINACSYPVPPAAPKEGGSCRDVVVITTHDFMDFIKLMRESMKRGGRLDCYVLFALPVPTRIAAASMTTADEPKELAGLSFERLEGKVVRPVGFEPTTRGLRVRCSTWLNYGRSPWGDHGLATPFANIVNPLTLRNLLTFIRPIKYRLLGRPGSSPAQASGGIAKALGFVDSDLGHGAGAATVLWKGPPRAKKTRPIIGPLRSPMSDNEIRV